MCKTCQNWSYSNNNNNTVSNNYFPALAAYRCFQKRNTNLREGAHIKLSFSPHSTKRGKTTIYEQARECIAQWPGVGLAIKAQARPCFPSNIEEEKKKRKKSERIYEHESHMKS